MKLVSRISYVSGDATKPVGAGPKVIAHICKDEGKWGKGFVLAVTQRWKEPEAVYRRQYKQNPKPQLGDVQFVEVEPQTTVANIIGQHGIRRGSGGMAPIRYGAVETALTKVAGYALAHGASVHMPRIGCGLAGGSWEEIEPFIKRSLADQGVDVVIYDFAK